MLADAAEHRKAAEAARTQTEKAAKKTAAELDKVFKLAADLQPQLEEFEKKLKEAQA